MNVASVVTGAGWTDAWAAAVWRAFWQGGIVLAIAWVITRALARMPAAYKCWVWRLAYVKLLLALCWAAPIPLRLLPATRAAGAAPVVAALPVKFPAAVEPADVPLRAAPAGPAPTRTIGRADALFAAWGAGVLLLTLRLAVGWRAARAIRRGSVAVDDVGLLEACDELAVRYRLRRPPPLVSNAGLRVPLLLGPVDPLVVLPADVAARHSAAELRLMLAHELAHLKRRDLWWNWLPAAAQTLLFFHPLVWLAASEWRSAQESACDEAAVNAAAAAPAHYAEMLLAVLSSRPGNRPVYPMLPATAAAGVAESLTTVRRRLTAMRYFNLQPPRRRSVLRRGLAIGAVCLAAALSLVPLRLAAKEPVPPAGAERPRVAPDAGPDQAAERTVALEGRAPEEETLLDLRELSFVKSPEADLAAGSDGIVRSVRVEVGQRVKKGEALVELDPARAVAELNLAKADLELKKLELDRKQQLLLQGNKAINKAEVAEAEVGLRRAENLLAIKEHELEQTRVVAPFDGVVAKVAVRPGVFLARGGPAVTVVETDTMWSEVQVHLAGLAALKKGMRAEMTPTGVPPPQEKTYLGRVTSISPVLRSGSQTGTVRVQFDTPPPDIRPGTYVKVRFLRDKHND